MTRSSRRTLGARLQLDRGGFRLDAEFEAPADRVVALFGPSGCGKSTLLRCLAGLESGVTGAIHLHGESWLDSARGLRTPAHRRGIGYVFQDGRLFPHLSVTANLAYGYRRTPPQRRQLGIEEVVEFLGLGELMDRHPSGLSGGETQRVALARALLTSPRLLLLDEPLAALDTPARATILPYLADLYARFAIPALYVSHQLDEVTRVAGHMLVMREGRIEASGSVTGLSTRTDLPLTGPDEVGAVLKARVAGHDEPYALTRLRLATGELWLSGHDEPPGTPLRVRILARDVALSLEPPVASSVLNVLPARVESLQEETRAHLLVRLRAGGDTLLARVTRRSAAALGLAPGTAVYAQIKSVAILG